MRRGEWAQVQSFRIRERLLICVRADWKNGFMPTVAEVAAEAGCARSTAYKHLNVLEAARMLMLVPPDAWRGVRVVVPYDEHRIGFVPPELRNHRTRRTRRKG